MTLNKDRSTKSVAFATALLAAALSFSAGAVAVAQTPSPGTTPGVTGTPQTPAPRRRPGTAQVTGTTTGTVPATGTVVVTGTTVVTGTAKALLPHPRYRDAYSVSKELYVAGGGPFAFANPQFPNTWIRTDLPVALGSVARTWFWGPGPNTPGLLEAVSATLPLGDGQGWYSTSTRAAWRSTTPSLTSARPSS